ncbi:extracellular solute-binding protein [Metapseudomonas furukawaii]|uniref:extracellular solute-binding protein n=1 Tax=Metapseudomonas furukawaii TaxID=1149133 RepID=UPI000564E244|nr:extracellular solute-binding protein [Pseudomonas furukawaii]
MHVTVLLVLLMALVSTQVPAQEVVRVHNWADYIDPGVIRDFERDTGIKVEYTNYATAAELEADLEGGDYFDVIVPSDFQLDRLIREKRLVEIDFSRLPNRSEVSKELLANLSAKRGADRYVSPYMWGAVGLVVNESAASRVMQAPIANSWSVLFDPSSTNKLHSCGVTLLNAQEETLSLYLNYKGKSLKSSSPRGIAKAARELQGLGALLSPSAFSTYISQLASGKVCAGMAWNGHVSAANGKGELRFTIPTEGGLMFIDSLAIPANAQNITSAYRFINYMLEPRIAVRNARATHFTPSLDLDRESYRRLIPDTFLPSREERRRLYFLEQLSGDQKRAIRTAWKQWQAGK